MTITHACGHKARHTIKGGTASTRSAQAFALAERDCPTCESHDGETCERCGHPLEFGFCEACFQDFHR